MKGTHDISIVSIAEAHHAAQNIGERVDIYKTSKRMSGICKSPFKKPKFDRTFITPNLP